MAEYTASGGQQQAHERAEHRNEQNGHDPLSQPAGVAQHLWGMGITVTHTKRGEKRMYHNGWQQDVVPPEMFAQVFTTGVNICQHNGALSSGTVDADFDAHESARIADATHPKTDMIFGHESKPRSHRIYRLQLGETLERGEHKWLDPDLPKDDKRATLLELRDSGQTITAGSLWTGKDGHTEPILFTADGRGAPAVVSKQELVQATNVNAAATLVARHWFDGARHDMSLPLCGFLARGGYQRDEARYLVELVCRAACDDDVTNRLASVESTYDRADTGDPYTSRKRLVDEGWLSHKQLDAICGWLGIETSRADYYPLTDTGNARRFADKYGDDYRFNHTMQRYHRWDGGRWGVDEKHQVVEDAKTIALDLFADAQALDAKERKQPTGNAIVLARIKALYGWARQSGMEQHISKMLKLAQSIKPLAAIEREFDANPLLLAFPNGYLHLDTGEFVPPYREAMITRCCAAPYAEDALDALWDETLARFLPDDAVRQDFQTAIGYCLSGRGKEHMFDAFGGTKRGKSTILMAIANALGDYATTVGLESFTAGRQQGGGGAREDLVALVGKRLVIASEATEHQRLNPAILKRMLGGSDKISLRANYGRQFETQPTFALWLLTNHQPKLPADDDAVWERLHVFPFDVYISPNERDVAKRDRVTDPTQTGAAILAWAVKGWLRYRDNAEKLELPTTVAATIAYRSTQDHLAAFIDERCEVGADKTVVFNRFKGSFREWMRQQGIREEWTDMRIGKALDRAGFPAVLLYDKVSDRKYRGRSGLSLPYSFDGVEVEDESEND